MDGRQCRGNCRQSVLASDAMRNQIIGAAIAACLAGAAWASPGSESSGSVEARVAKQNALFEEEFQADLKAHPEVATAYGDYRYNARLNDYSLAAIKSQHAADERFLTRLKAIANTGFAETDALSRDVMLRLLEQRVANYEFQEYEMPVSQMDGPHLHLADLPLAVPLDSVEHYEDYIARLKQIPRVFTETEAVLRVG